MTFNTSSYTPVTGGTAPGLVHGLHKVPEKNLQKMKLLYIALVICGCSGRPQVDFQSNQNNQFQNAPQFNPNQFRNSNPNQFRNSNPIDDLSSGISGLANGARATAVLVEEGGGAGVDILSQFGQLFGN